MGSIFSKIIAGEIPSYKVAEDEHFYAFLDIRPLAKGHTLVVPKVEIDYIFDLGDEQLSSYILFARKVAHAIERVVPCKRIGMSVIGLEVPHAHIHLLPIRSVSDMNFSNPPLQMSPEEMTQLATDIANQFDRK